MTTETALTYTGERVIPDLMRPDDRVLMEHLERYFWAAGVLTREPYISEVSVLDVPCGAGYGTALLGAVAGHGARGLDRDIEVVNYARRRYGSVFCRFAERDMAEPFAVDPLHAAAICFEGIEHVEHQALAARHLCEAVRPGGLIMVSTPRAGSEGAGSRFHTHELSVDAFADLFEPYLRDGWQLIGQNLRVGDAFVDDARYMILLGRRAG